MVSSGFLSRLFKGLVYRFLRLVSRMLVVCLCDFRTHGRHHLKGIEGAILLSTHQSMLDPVLVGICDNERLNYIARKTLFRNKLFALLIRTLDAIEIDRDRGGLAGLKVMLKRLQNNKRVLLFPEGTRTTDGNIGSLKMGFIPIARRSQVPLIPIAIVGAYRILPRGQNFPQPQSLAVVFGPPIMPDELQTLDDVGLGDRLTRELDACKAKGEKLTGGLS